MDWLRDNWIWVAVIVLILWMHGKMHGRHAAHGGHEGQEGPEGQEGQEGQEGHGEHEGHGGCCGSSDEDSGDEVPLEREDHVQQ
jgi:hypothetical protein